MMQLLDTEGNLFDHFSGLQSYVCFTQEEEGCPDASVDEDSRKTWMEIKFHTQSQFGPLCLTGPVNQNYFTLSSNLPVSSICYTQLSQLGQQAGENMPS